MSNNRYCKVSIGKINITPQKAIIELTLILTSSTLENTMFCNLFRKFIKKFVENLLYTKYGNGMGVVHILENTSYFFRIFCFEQLHGPLFTIIFYYFSPGVFLFFFRGLPSVVSSYGSVSFTLPFQWFYSINYIDYLGFSLPRNFWI